MWTKLLDPYVFPMFGSKVPIDFTFIGSVPIITICNYVYRCLRNFLILFRKQRRITRQPFTWPGIVLVSYILFYRNVKDIFCKSSPILFSRLPDIMSYILHTVWQYPYVKCYFVSYSVPDPRHFDQYTVFITNPDPDPALFGSGFQDSNKNWIFPNFFGFFSYYRYINIHGLSVS